MEVEATLLKFTTAGSVDDGKSTLIGRLLYDTQSVFDNQINEIKTRNKLENEDNVNLAFLTDGLKNEREQGITIDVAYRYFETKKRKFILADAPGHFQYTRNMVTSASTSDLVILLIDARNGIVEQTKRHAFIASLLKIKHLIVCINKMDLVNFSQKIFEKVKNDFLYFSPKLNIPDIKFIPTSAINGDNIVSQSNNMEWYKEGFLLYHLENVDLSEDQNINQTRFPVQYVIKEQSKNLNTFKGYAGTIASGIINKGDYVTVLPKKINTKIKKIVSYDGEYPTAFCPMSVVLELVDNIDISRGNMIVKTNNQPNIEKKVELMICWMSNNELKLNAKYFLRHTTKETMCMVSEIIYKINISTFEKESGDTITTNDLAKIIIDTDEPIFYDSFSLNKITGSLILIDPLTNETVGGGMII